MMKSGGIFENKTKGEAVFPTTPLLLVLLASLIAGLLTPTPSLGGVDKKVSDVCQKSTDAAFRAKYCSAAKGLKQGYITNLATSAVWSGVSVACIASCGKAVAGIACQMAKLGGTAGESILTKKFSDSLVSEGMKYGGSAITGKTADAGTATDAATSTSESKVNGDACAVAGTSALKASQKFSDSNQNDKSLTVLRDQTKDMNTPTGNAKGVNYSADTANTSLETAAATNPACSDAALGSALGAIRCAASADQSLPPYVKSEAFLQDLQKATGKSPDTFFANFESPAKSIFDSPTAAALPEGQQHALADSLSAMKGYADSKSAGVAMNAAPTNEMTTGAGAGHLRAAGEGDTGFDMNGMIAGVLGQMNGAAEEKNGEATNPGSSLTIDRRPARNVHAAEDRRVSIFDRVQWRYGAVSARDQLGVP